MIFTILIGIVGLGLMVFIHELGHFIAAKACGVEVEVFSLGWGTKLIGFTRGGTTYQISWFPIGGYCKMKGEVAFRQALEKDLAEMPKEEGSFSSAPQWKRIVISAAGPLFNLIFAVLIFTMIWWVGFRVYSADNRVILATDYTMDSFAAPPPATVAGLKTGDRVIAIDGKPVDKFQDIVETVSLSPNRRLLFTVERTEGGAAETLTVPITPDLDKSSGAGKVGIYSWVDPVINGVTPGGAAFLSGLKKGDRILEVDGKKVASTIDIFQLLVEKPSKLAVLYDRLGVRRTTDLIPSYKDSNPAVIGIDWATTVFRSPSLGFGKSLLRSFQETGMTIGLTVKGIGLLFQGINLRNAVAGPLRITYYIGSAATSGFQLGFAQGVVDFFRLLSFLSVVLFLMNLLPIPAMDGGQILIFVLEIVRGRPVRPRTIGRVQFIGFSVLIALSLFITFSDILFFLGR